MNRYSNTEEYKTEDGQTYQGVTRYPEIPETENDIYVITTYGDRLDLLANQYYKDWRLYWIIAAANPSLPSDSLYPTLGVQIRIPGSPEDVINSFNNINNG
tara:strand:- start:445 stop:747 length:303 start_codon:yes stop_codon:yes gene_type:complete